MIYISVLWLQFSANGEQQQQFIPEVELSIMSKMARGPDGLSVSVTGRVFLGGGGWSVLRKSAQPQSMLSG